MDDDRRRYPRHKQALSVLVKERQGGTRLLTADVSRKGAFVVTDSPWPERELVHLCFDLPDGDPIELLGMVTRRVGGSDDDTDPGMGIDFFALSAEARDRWDSFVLGLPEDEDEDEPAESAGSVEPPERPPVRRQHRRFLSRFLVRMRDTARLREFYTRDISGGGMFLRTPTPTQVRSDVELILVHPESEEEFSLSGRVVRVVDEESAAERGVGIEFDPLPLEWEALLLSFIETGVNYLCGVEESGHERVALIMRAVEAMGERSDALVQLGELLLREVEPESAEKAFRKALERDPQLLLAHRGLYKVYSMLDDPDRARKHLEAVRRLGDDDD